MLNNSFRVLIIISNNLLISTLVLLLSIKSFSQVPTETWRTHPNFSKANGLYIQNEVVYCFTKNGFFRYFKNQKKTEILTQNNGLSDKIVTAITFVNEKTAVIGYESGTIDIISVNNKGDFEDVTAIEFIKNAAAIEGNKQINKLLIKENKIYAATEFGLVEIDLQTKQVIETYRNIGPNGTSVAIKNIASKNDSLFLDTTFGVLGGSLKKNINLLFYENWQLIRNSTLFEKKIQLPDIKLITIPNDVLKDTKGFLWIADENNGLLSNISGNWEAYSPNGLPENEGELLKIDNTIYFKGNNKTYAFIEDAWELKDIKINSQNTLTDSYGNKWSVNFGRLRVEKDGAIYLYSQSNGINGVVNGIYLDKDEQIWVATSNGVYVLPITSKSVSSPEKAYAPVFENQRLLLQQNVLSLLIDDGNRKWFGTANGLFEFSENVDKLNNYFTSNNSLLFDNQIFNLEIDDKGELFVQTQFGVASYQTSSSKPSNDLSEIKLFPNPIKAQFEGVFTIKGLVEDAKIKIADAAGKVVFTTESNGGSAVWDIKTPDGTRAASGVYFVFIVSDNFLEKFIGKFAVIN